MHSSKAVEFPVVCCVPPEKTNCAWMAVAGGCVQNTLAKSVNSYRLVDEIRWVILIVLGTGGRSRMNYSIEYTVSPQEFSFIFIQVQELAKQKLGLLNS